MAQGLTPRQLRFVDEYLIDLNATQAYRRVYGGTEKAARAHGARLVAKGNVAAEIAKKQAERSERTQITQDHVLHELVTLLRSDVRDFRVGEAGELELREGVPDSAWRAVSSVKHRRIVTGKGEDKEVTYEIEYRLWDKPATIRMAGQHLGMFTEKHEVSGPDGGPIELRTDELRDKLNARIAGLSSRIVPIAIAKTNGNGNGSRNGNGRHG